MNAFSSIWQCLECVAQKIHITKVSKSQFMRSRGVSEKFKMLSMPLTKHVLCCNLQLNCACAEAAASAKKVTV